MIYTEVLQAIDSQTVQQGKNLCADSTVRDISSELLLHAPPKSSLRGRTIQLHYGAISFIFPGHRPGCGDLHLIRVKATVQTPRHPPARVSLLFQPHLDRITVTCNCSAAAVCHHAVVVLLHMEKDHSILYSSLPLPQPAPLLQEELILSLRNSNERLSPVFKCTPPFTHRAVLLFSPADPILKRRPFHLNRDETYLIKPARQRISPGNGGYGHISRIIPVQTAVGTATEAAAKFFTRICKTHGNFAPLSENADQLLALHRQLPCYLDNKGKSGIDTANPVKMTLRRISSLYLHLQPVSTGNGGGAIQLHPVLGESAEAVHNNPDLLSRITVTAAGTVLAVNPLQRELLYIQNAPELALMLNKLTKADCLLSYSQAADLAAQISNSVPHLKCDPPAETVSLSSPLPVPVVQLTKRFNGVDIALLFSYEKKLIAPDENGNYTELPERNRNTVRLARRDLNEENRLLQLLLKLLHNDYIPERSRPESGAFYLLTTYEKFLQTGLRLLGQNGFLIALDRGSTPLHICNASKIEINLLTRENWFEVTADMKRDGELLRINLRNLRRGLIEQDGELFLLSDEQIEKMDRFTEAVQSAELESDGSYRINKNHFFLLDRLKELLNHGKPDDSEQVTADKLLRPPQQTIPATFNGTLRPYQQYGVEWLSNLYRHGLHGCLADDMGLGKTVQTIALIELLRHSGEERPVLLVVPVSTVFNWREEIERFAPRQQIVIHRGAGRNRYPGNLSRPVSVITTYHTLKQDIAWLRQVEFGLTVLDEAQAIKNSRTALFQTVKKINSARRLSLTGTPLENTVMELWSQMEFLNPALLGKRSKFVKRFRIPIERQRSKPAAEHLHRLTAPFLLRRTKEEVAAELPEKDIQTVFLQMDDRQKLLYQTVLQHFHDQITEARAKLGNRNRRTGKFAMMEFFALVSQGLLRLRQICLLPQLADKQWQGTPSCKMEYLLDQTAQLHQSKQKTLLYSQFTSVLHQIKARLNHPPHALCYLDGQTRNRKEQVERFQNDPEVTLFLLSLKAGGTGLNLTAADYVFLFDPWWNPAVEMQAIDRAHRIGRREQVFARKLIVKDTIEEKILHLQQDKQQLAEALIAPHPGLMQSLNAEELIELFK